MFGIKLKDSYVYGFQQLIPNRPKTAKSQNNDKCQGGLTYHESS